GGFAPRPSPRDAPPCSPRARRRRRGRRTPRSSSRRSVARDLDFALTSSRSRLPADAALVAKTEPHLHRPGESLPAVDRFAVVRRVESDRVVSVSPRPTDRLANDPARVPFPAVSGLREHRHQIGDPRPLPHRPRLPRHDPQTAAREGRALRPFYNETDQAPRPESRAGPRAVHAVRLLQLGLREVGDVLPHPPAV